MTRRFAPPEYRVVVHAVAVVLLITAIPGVLFAAPSVVGADTAVVPGLDTATASGSHTALLVDHVGADQIEKGDLVVFRFEDGMVVRRVGAVIPEPNGGYTFVTESVSGDGYADEPVTDEELVGRVAYTLPLVGAIARWLSGPNAMLYRALLVLPYLVVGVMEARYGYERFRSEGSGDGDVSLTAADLTLTTGALVAFAAFAVWSLLEAPSAIALGVAIAAFGSAAVSAYVRFFALRPSTHTDDTSPTEAVVDGGIPPELLDYPRILVGSRQQLFDMARTAGQRVFAENGTYALLHDDHVYVYEESPDRDRSVASGEGHERSVDNDNSSSSAGGD